MVEYDAVLSDRHHAGLLGELAQRRLLHVLSVVHQSRRQTVGEQVGAYAVLALQQVQVPGLVMDEHDDAWRVTAHLATHGDAVPATGRQRDAHVLHVEHRPLVHGLS